MCYKQSQCSYHCCQRVFACACMCMQCTQQRRKKKQQHVSMYEKISFPHMPGPQPASCSLRKKGAFSARCPLWLHWGFSSQVTAFLSHVPAEQSAGTFHQSAGRDGSSGIILTVGPSQDEIRRWLADRHAHLAQSREILFHHHRCYYYSEHNHVPADGVQKKKKKHLFVIGSDHHFASVQTCKMRETQQM